MKTEYWRWRYRDSEGRVRRTAVAMTEQEAAASYPGVERIEGTMSLRDSEHALAHRNEPACDQQPIALGSLGDQRARI